MSTKLKRMEKKIKSSLQIKIITCNYDYIYCVLYSSMDIIAYVTGIGSRITLAHHLCIKNFYRVCYRFEDGHLFWQNRDVYFSVSGICILSIKLVCYSHNIRKMLVSF